MGLKALQWRLKTAKDSARPPSQNLYFAQKTSKGQSGHSQERWGLGHRKGNWVREEAEAQETEAQGRPRLEPSSSPRDRPILPHTTPGVPVTCRAAATPAARVPLPAQAGAALGAWLRLRQRRGGGERAGAAATAAVAAAAAPVSSRHAPFRGSVRKPASRSNSTAANGPLLPLPIAAVRRTSGYRVTAGAT